MNLNTVSLIIGLLWIFSEIILARVKRSGSKISDKTDRNSLRVIWITIAVSTTLGWVFGISTMGHIYGLEYTFGITGLILITIGILIRAIAIIILNKYFTVDVAIVSDHKLIKSGMYKYVRHPSYTGSLLSFVGLGIFWSNWISMILIILPVFAAFSYRIKVEEEVLIKNFGEEYISYSYKTKKLLPKIY
jgi:protein-S-isoprenylcysteine O-methyltransferase Ste14